MEEALAGHEATLSALNSMSCALVSKYKNANAEGEIAAKYFRDGSRVRTEYLDHGRRNISVRGPDGVLYSFGPTSGPNGVASLVISDDSTALTHGDAWRKGLLYFPGSTKRWETLAELAKSCAGTATRTTENGQDCVLVTFSHERAKVRIWLSRERGYLASKM